MLKATVRSTSLETLATSLKADWPHIQTARKNTDNTAAELARSLENVLPVSEDASLVVFGSFARREQTTKSDLDWTFLIDGQATSDHLTLAQRLKDKISTLREQLGFEREGPTGTFGTLAFSHELIHHIGGQHDSNQNMTRRILLLLESRAIGASGRESDAYRRVITGVLNRYLEEEANLLNEEKTRYKVPRFLLNDTVRFWRTMAVDFASKQRDRGGIGWGLRNAKLRMSRKLIFASGLLMCFACSADVAPENRSKSLDFQRAALVDFLKNFVCVTPLDIVADAVMRYGTQPTAVSAMFTAYDQFLALLNNQETRERLNNLRSEKSRTDVDFQRVRRISKEFQDGLDALFFSSNEGLSALTKKYGIF